MDAFQKLDNRLGAVWAEVVDIRNTLIDLPLPSGKAMSDILLQIESVEDDLQMVMYDLATYADRYAPARRKLLAALLAGPPPIAGETGG